MLPPASVQTPCAPRAAAPASGHRIAALLDWARTRLTPHSSSPELDAEILLALSLRRPKSTLIGFPERAATLEQTDRFRELIARRATGVPVAHLTGWREFYSLRLRVSPETLVPRPETELLVDKLLERFDAGADATVLDAGTGCGAVALAVKHCRPRCRVTALDSCAAALAVAAANGARLGFRVRWIQSHWFAGLAQGRFDFVVANPPYVPHNDAALVTGDLRHEPRQALDGGAKGLESIQAIILAAPRVLTSGGTLLLEHGFDQARAVQDLLRSGGFRSVETHRDLANRDRVTIGTSR